MCWLAIGFLLIIFVFLWGRSYKEALYQNDLGQVFVEGTVTDKQYKESVYGDYWVVTLKKVQIVREKRKFEQETVLKDIEITVHKDNFLKDVETVSEIEALEGKYFCSISSDGNEELKIGQKVLLKGTFASWEEPTNPGQFNTGKYYCSLGILGQFKKCTIIEQGVSFSWIREGMWKLRQEAGALLLQELGEENGGLISAMLLGEKSGLGEEQKSLYQRNGISHILAISGLHLSLLGMGVFRVLKIILANHRQASLVSIVIMLFYCIFTGNSISTIRATVMFALSLLAGMLGRSYDSLSALGLAAILQLFLNPYVLNNSGFLLSFLAVIGVTFIAKRLQELLGAKHKITKSLCVSFSATITTLPVLLWNYGNYPWYSVFLNLLILPPMSILLFLSVLLLFLLMPFERFLLLHGLRGKVETMILGNVLFDSSFVFAIKHIVIWIIKLILKYFEICCKVFEKIAGWEEYIGAPTIFQIVIYTILVMVAISRLVKHSDLVRKMILLSAISILTMNFNLCTEITMLDVGQGDSVVIRNDNGHVYISDCGSSSVSKVGKYRLLPFLKYKGYGKIKGIFISHLDEDHMNGIVELLEMASMERIKIEYLFLPESVLKTGEDREVLIELQNLAKKNGTGVIYLTQGEEIKDGRMHIYCLYPEGIGDMEKGNSKKNARNLSEGRNNQSLVLLIQYGEFEMMLTGDVESLGEEKILLHIEQKSLKVLEKGTNMQDISLDVLKVAHHGSSGSSSEEFLEKVKPKLSLISCGKNNKRLAILIQNNDRFRVEVA